MLNKRGYSYGAEFTYHFELRADGWAVFHAGTDVDVESGIVNQWDAARLCEQMNEHPCADSSAIDLTP